MFLKRYSLVILVVSLLVLFFIFFIESKKVDFKHIAQQISLKCEKDRIKCLTQEFMNYAGENPKHIGELLESFEKDFLDVNNKNETEALLYYVHDVGMLLVDKNFNLEDSFKYCGLSFMQGCIHGVMMEYADTFNVSRMSDLLNLCKDNALSSLVYLNCIHGVGHVLASKNEVNISKVANFCDVFKNRYEEISCVSGVFMEYSKGGAGRGFHSELPLGQIHLDCSIFTDLYYDTCKVY